MNVSVSGCRYLVITPAGARYYVSKDKACTCQKNSCTHIDAVSLYLKMKGAKAKTPEPLPTLQQRADYIRSLRRNVIDSQQLSLMAQYILEVLHIGESQQERLAFCKKWELRYQWVTGDLQPRLL